MKYLKSMCIVLLLATTIPSSNISALTWDKIPSREWGSARKVGMTIYGILSIPVICISFLEMYKAINSNKSSWDRGWAFARLTGLMLSFIGGTFVITDDICTCIESGIWPMTR